MTYHFRNTGSTSFNTGTNWSFITGGPSAGVVPTTGDDIIFDVNSGNCIVDIAGKVMNSITFTAYPNTLTPTNSIQTVDFLVPNGTLGKVGVAAGSVLISRHLTISATRGLVGTGKVVLNGTGTWSGTGGGYVFCNVDVNTAGTVTLTNIVFAIGKITRVAGTTITTGTAEFGLGAGYTLDVNGDTSGSATTTSSTGINFNNVLLNGGSGTFSSPVAIVGNTTAQGTVIVNGSSVYLKSSLINNTNVNGITGSSTLVFKGTGTISGTINTINTNVTIDTAGTITLTGTLNYFIGTFNRVSGSVVTTGHTLNVNINTTTTFSTSGMSWNNVNITTGTVNFNSQFSATNLTIGSAANVAFGGSSGFTVTNLTCNVPGRIITYSPGRTYTVTGNLSLMGGYGSPIDFTSSSTGALFNLQVGATQNVQFTSATWINSSGGQTIWTTKGILTNTTNWNSRDRTDWIKAF